MNTRPRVSILMPVYSGEKYVGEAINSILRQTFHEFEFIIVDDGSTDSTPSILRNYRDERIRIISFTSNRGLPTALNAGHEVCRGDYIARIDADDISAPNRLEVQTAFMDAHSDINICGTDAETTGAVSRRIRHPAGHNDIVAKLLVGCSLTHPTVMIRRAFMTETGQYYDGNYRHAEDYELWTRLVRYNARFANIQENLLIYRLHGDNVFVAHGPEQIDTITRVVKRELRHLLGRDIDDRELSVYWDLRNSATVSWPRLRELIEFTNVLMRANQKDQTYNQQSLAWALSENVYPMVAQHTDKGIGVWLAYQRALISRSMPMGGRLTLRLLRRSLARKVAGT